MIGQDEDRVLEGLELVVVGEALVGQFLCKILVDQGVRAHRVAWRSRELPNTARLPFDVVRDPGTVVDLDEVGVEALAQQIEHADLFLDVLPTDALGEAGFGSEELQRKFPSLLVHSIRPYSAGLEIEPYGEEWSVAASLGFFRTRSGRPAEILPVPLVSGLAALSGAVAVVGALLARAKGRELGASRTNLFDSALMALTASICEVAEHGHEEAKGPFRSAGDLRYRCADGRSVQITSNVPSVATALFAAIDRPEWLGEALDDLISDRSGRAEKDWQERLASVFIARPAAEWERIISEAGGACAECETSEEWCRRDHAKTTGAVIDGEEGPTAGPVMRLSMREPRPRARGDRPERWPTSAPFGVLAGVQVLEFSVILAGPSGGRVLAEMGAEVVKIDAPSRATPPYIGQKGWLDVNRSKRNVLLDLRTPEGREAAWRLVGRSDVVIDSYREGKMAALGFGPENVMASNPDAVYVSLNAFDFGGPLSPRPGWEPLAQAVTGIHLNPDPDGVPPRIPLPLDDFGSGLVCAYGAMMGLLAREKTGRGSHVRASLTRTATFFSQTEFGRKEDEAPRYLGGQELAFLPVGTHVLVAASTYEQLDEQLASDPAVARLLKEEDADGLIVAIRNLGTPCVLANTPRDLISLSQLREVGLVKEWAHPNWGNLVQAFPDATAEGVTRRQGWPASDPGEDTQDVLAELGFSPVATAAMLQSGAARGRVALFGN